MIYDNYIEWKKWSQNDFAKLTPGNHFHFQQIFNEKLKEKSRILEIGFGNGELLGYFNTKEHEVIGVEINCDLVNRAKNAGYVAHLGTVWDIPELETEKFDLIVAFAVVEHLNYVDLKKLFIWFNNHLKDGGFVYLKFPEGSSPLALGYQHGDFTHISCLTKPKLELLCNISNLNLLSYDDELLVSNKLCSFGLVGRTILVWIQLYSKMLKFLIRIILFPLCTTIKLSTNSIAVITRNIP
jgi:hypothetical protein